MARPDGRGRALPALALVVVGLVAALQTLPLAASPEPGVASVAPTTADAVDPTRFAAPTPSTVPPTPVSR